MDSELDAWAHMWHERKSDFVLLKVAGDDLNSIDHCLIHDTKDRSTLWIDDDRLVSRIMQRMKAAGVPILKAEQLPPGENELAHMINEMLEAGIPTREINVAITEYKRSHDKHD